MRNMKVCFICALADNSLEVKPAAGFIRSEDPLFKSFIFFYTQTLNWSRFKGPGMKRLHTVFFKEEESSSIQAMDYNVF